MSCKFRKFELDRSKGKEIVLDLVGQSQGNYSPMSGMTFFEVFTVELFLDKFS